ncbi:phosphoesterase-domain-containing protein [Hesseltinella vesiculosa]|uniref:Phosphoesterase-domain-containing protein n=1 Tax=Hesseltinella vesiculosa TaxID=101127 RepID=A0A1X2G4W4_9FUNG|nr:phosphoesterase-domain-containing protein [Hesseltinella vesiculosa]
MKIQAAIAALAVMGSSLCALANPVSRDSSQREAGLDKIKHVVLFMQENRSFDHYFGTSYGTRNFQDPNVGIQKNGLNLFYQPDSSSTDVKNGTKYLLPYRLGGKRAGCTEGGSNAWTENHSAWNNGTNDNWTAGNSPGSMGYLTRDEIIFLYALTDAFAVADGYHQSVIGPTEPNRLVWMSGTNAADGRVVTNNIEIPGMTWETYPEVLTKANITWQVFEDLDNFDDNSLLWFEYWRWKASLEERKKGILPIGLSTFYDRAKAGTLPQVSIIIAPRELSEHPDNVPAAGHWLQEQVYNAVTSSPSYNETALIISYDENGGFYDHVIPPVPPTSEWVLNPPVPNGLGSRVPFIVVSPWTRGASVYTELLDHTSQLKFLEQWIGYDSNGTLIAPCNNIDDWHRQTTGDLVSIFDFDHPDYTTPAMPVMDKPSSILGVWTSTESCELQLTAPKTKPPYGNQTYPQVEKGTRQVRGHILEGRTYTLTQGSLNSGATVVQATSANSLVVGSITSSDTASTTWTDTSYFIVHQIQGQDQYLIESAAQPGQCLSVKAKQVALAPCQTASSFAFDYQASGAQHLIKDTGSGFYITTQRNALTLTQSPSSSWSVYSVSH